MEWLVIFVNPYELWIKEFQDGVMVLDRFVPYKHHTKGNPDVDFVIYPSARNSDWNIGTVITSTPSSTDFKASSINSDAFNFDL